MKRLLLIILLVTYTIISYSQTREHLVGIRTGINISGMDSRPDMEYQSITTTKNYSFVYTYYHNLWGMINNFGFQTGISTIEQGFKRSDEEIRFQVIQIPIVSQFHIDFWRMRFLINAGCFGGYRYSKTTPDGSGFDEFDKRVDYGFIVGSGLAFIFKPIEIHLEGNYHYSLSYSFDPKKFSQTDYLFTYPKQLLFTMTVNVKL